MKQADVRTIDASLLEYYVKLEDVEAFFGKYAKVPIVRKTGGLADTAFDMDDNSQPELANGFVFEGIDEGSFNWALDCAFSYYRKIGMNYFIIYSRFVFDPAKWPQMEMDEDFLKLSKMFNAMRYVVRVPNLDSKYNISVLASKQDHCLLDLLHGWQDGRLPVHITSVIRLRGLNLLKKWSQYCIEGLKKVLLFLFQPGLKPKKEETICV